MHKSIVDLEEILEKYTGLLQATDSIELESIPTPGKWSKKEIIGHLIDSAHNNLRRFIVGQYDDKPHIIYRQDDWVKLNNYQDAVVHDLINLWFLLNKQIVTVLKNTTEEKLQRVCLTESEHTIAFLATDYNSHLVHHLHQVLELDKVPYP